MSLSTGRAAAIAGIVLVVAATGATTTLLLRSRLAAPADRVAAQIGTVAVVYPPAYARFGPGRSGGLLDRIEMAFTFPDLRAAGDAASALPADDSVGPATRQLVFVTLRREDELADPADRTEKIYARFLQSDVWQEEAGLVMRRFEAGSPYEREELHFVPPEGRVFAARCVRPTQPPSDLPSTCLSALRLDGLDIDIRFSPTLLPRWEALTDGVKRLITSFVVK